MIILTRVRIQILKEKKSLTQDTQLRLNQEKKQMKEKYVTAITFPTSASATLKKEMESSANSSMGKHQCVPVV